MSIDKKNVIDDNNLLTLLKSLFSKIEGYYVRKTKYNEDIAALEARIKTLEEYVNSSSN